MKRFFRYYFGGLFYHLQDKQVFLWAQAIGFKTLITLVPISILATGAIGKVLQRDRPFQVVARFIRNFMPASQEDRMIDLLSQLQGAGTTFTIVGVVGLLVTATTLFTTIRLVIGNVFREEWHDHRSTLRGYAFDFRMALQVGAFFAASLLLTVILQAGGPTMHAALSAVGIEAPFLLQGWTRFIKLFGILFPYLLTVGMFFQFLWFTPKPRPPGMSALAGAVVGATLWEIAKWGFAIYAKNVGIGEDWVGAVGDTFGLVIALVLWAYYSGVVLIIAAIVALLHEIRQREGARHPDETAGDMMASSDPEEKHEQQSPEPDADPQGADRPQHSPRSDGPPEAAHPQETSGASDDGTEPAQTFRA